MVRFTLAAATAAVLALTNAQTAQAAHSIAKHCPFPDICYSLNLPTKIFTAGGGTLYFQISGPASYSWIALGQGDAMEGANIFVIYADGKGNVTLSPRLGVAMVEPMYNPDAEVELLAGSGIMDGKMIANVRCNNCNTWNGGSMDLKSDIAMWIASALPGPPLDSTDPEEHIMQHLINAVFPWSVADARGGNDTNPFLAAQRSARPPLGGVGTKMAIAHGVMASTAFIALLPAGAIFIRFAKFPGLVWVHAGIQLTGYAVFVAAAGMGIHMMLSYPGKYHRYELYTDPHPKIGMALLAYLFFQPISGFLNHWLFGKKNKRLFSHHIHIWGARLVILLGFVNGGFGLRLGKVEETGAKVAYGVFATIMGILFVLNIVYAQAQRHGPNPSLLHRRNRVEPGAVGDGSGHVRMESMEERERLHAGQGDGGRAQ